MTMTWRSRARLRLAFVDFCFHRRRAIAEVVIRRFRTWAWGGSIRIETGVGHGLDPAGIALLDQFKPRLMLAGKHPVLVLELGRHALDGRFHAEGDTVRVVENTDAVGGPRGFSGVVGSSR